MRDGRREKVEKEDMEEEMEGMETDTSPGRNVGMRKGGAGLGWGFRLQRGGVTRGETY
jgi:hypothetical protein